MAELEAKSQEAPCCAHPQAVAHQPDLGGVRAGKTCADDQAGRPAADLGQGSGSAIGREEKLAALTAVAMSTWSSGSGGEPIWSLLSLLSLLLLLWWWTLFLVWWKAVWGVCRLGRSK